MEAHLRRLTLLLAAALVSAPPLVVPMFSVNLHVHMEVPDPCFVKYPAHMICGKHYSPVALFCNLIPLSQLPCMEQLPCVNRSIVHHLGLSRHCLWRAAKAQARRPRPSLALLLAAGLPLACK